MGRPFERLVRSGRGGRQENKTIEMLRARGRDDLADMVERGMISGTDAASQLLATPKDDRTAGIKEYQQAVSDGFKGTFLEYKTALQKAGATSVTVGGEGAEAFDKEFGKLDAQSLADVAKVGATASRSLAQIGRLEALLGNIDSGMGASIQQFAGNFGIQTEGLDDIQAAAALINALVPAQRPPGSGPMSDADLELFKQSLPRIINSPGGNQIIINTMRGLAEYDAEGARIVQRLRRKEITQADAFELLNSRADPFAAFKAPTGQAPTGGLDRRCCAEDFWKKLNKEPIMAETMTSAESSQILQAIKVLEKLEADGTITASEQAALDRAREKRKPAKQAELETRATYGGFTAGAMMNLNDEARGAI